MRDVGYLATFIALVSLFSFGLAWLLARTSGPLSRKQILLIAPLPLPALIVGLCVLLLVNASLASAEECGVDACGMAAAGAIVGLAVSLVAYFVGRAFADLGYRAARKPE